MIKNKFGRIIFISSSTAENGYPGNIAEKVALTFIWKFRI